MSKASRKSKRQPRIGVCAYCGATGNVEREHVIPRTMFRDRANSTFVVNACRACNVDKSRYDNELRDFAIISMNSERYPHKNEILQRVARANSRNQSRIGRQLRWLAKPLSFVHDGKIIDSLTAPISGEDQRIAVEYIARAVWFRHFGTVATAQMVESRYFDMFDIEPEGMLIATLQAAPTIQLLDREGVALIGGWPYEVGDRGRKVLFLTMRFYGGPAYSVVLDNRHCDALESEQPVASLQDGEINVLTTKGV